MPDEQEVLYEDKYMRVTKIPGYEDKAPRYPDISSVFVRVDEVLARQRKHDTLRARSVSAQELRLLKKELQTMTAAVAALTKKMDQFRDGLSEPRRRWYHKLFGIGNEKK